MQDYNEPKARVEKLEDKTPSLEMDYDYKIKKLSIWVGFLKFVMGTVIVGLVTAGLNQQIQNRTLAQKEKEQEQQYVAQFIENALNERLVHRHRFAHYFSTLLGGNWQNYYADIDSIYQREVAKLDSLKKEAKTDSTNLEVQQQSIEVARELTPTQLENQVWFVVIFSTPTLPPAKDFAKKTMNLLVDQGEVYPIEIYKTKISQHFAVTVGGRLTKLEALHLSSFARKKGWAHDAFYQIDKDWAYVETVFPSSSR